MPILPFDRPSCGEGEPRHAMQSLLGPLLLLVLLPLLLFASHEQVAGDS